MFNEMLYPHVENYLDLHKLGVKITSFLIISENTTVEILTFHKLYTAFVSVLCHIYNLSPSAQVFSSDKTRPLMLYILH
jgi:hypothetical protein